MSTAIGEIAEKLRYSEPLAELRNAFSSGATRSIEWRRNQLGRLEALVQENITKLSDALHQDLGKCASESWITDLGLSLSSIRSARKKLRAWTSPERVRNPIGLMPAKSFVISEPLGVVLIIAP